MLPSCRRCLLTCRPAASSWRCKCSTCSPVLFLHVQALVDIVPGRLFANVTGCVTAERPPTVPEGAPLLPPWPPAALVRACMEAADALGDARFLPPALPGLGPREALALLPRLLGLAAPSFRAGVQAHAHAPAVR